MPSARICYDCKVSRSDVSSRQCEYFLCDDCDAKRREEIKRINQTKTVDEAVTGLSRYVESLKSTIEANTDETKNDSASAFPKEQSSSDNAHPLPNIRCSSTTCNVTTPNESRCSCFICSQEWHIVCASLKKPPAKSTKWACPNCKNIHSLMKTLQTTVADLQREMNFMVAEQKSLNKKQENLCKENAKLKKELNLKRVDLQKQVNQLGAEQKTLKKNQDTLLKENANLKNELSDLRRPTDPLNIAFSANESDHNVLRLNDEPSRTLIIGDSMLRDLKDNVFENTDIKSMSGAKMTDIFTELHSCNELPLYRDIVIHAGTNDISRKIPLHDTILSLEAVITLIMVEAPLAHVYISAVCPRTDESLNQDIIVLNDELKEIANHLDCHFIDAGLKMTYRNGDIDGTMFIDGLHLNERGNRALINAFKDSIPGLSTSLGEWTTVHGRLNKEREFNSQSQIEHNRESLREDFDYTQGLRDLHGDRYDKYDVNDRIDRNGGDDRIDRNGGNDRNNRNDRNGKNSRNGRNGSIGRNDRNNRNHRNTYNNYRQSNEMYAQLNRSRLRSTYTSRDFYADTRSNSGRAYSGCYNCGLDNHNQNTCYYQTRLRCHTCNSFGHKERYCNSMNINDRR